MAITRNYSGPALISAGVIAVLLGFVSKLAGLAIYLFGVIGMQGIALMQEHKVRMFDPRGLAGLAHTPQSMPSLPGSLRKCLQPQEQSAPSRSRPP